MASSSHPNAVPMEILELHPDAVPMEVLEERGAKWKYGHDRNATIIRSTSAIVSVISSFALIRMIMKSKQRLSTTYHRILLGMSIGDILFSLPLATFQATIPSDMSYTLWNARGSQASCSASGFVVVLGMNLTLCYSCSLNIFYLFKVKYNKSDSYIQAKIEPFLHGVPILFALIFSITGLANDNYNGAGGGACATTPVHNPPHCIGYEDGEVREGFTIPCGRGGNKTFFFLTGIVMMFAIPIIIGVLLGMLYRHVTKQEKSMARFSVGDVNRDSSSSRAVLHKALAYSTAYFLTWVWRIGAYISVLAGLAVSIWYSYLWVFFQPLEGFFNLLVFMHPKVVAAKKSRGVSLPRAFAIALWAGLTGGDIKKKKTARNAGENNFPVESGDKKGAMGNSCATVGPIQNSANTVSTGGTSSQLCTTPTLRKSLGDIEEEKTEIQAPLDGDDFVENLHT